MKATNQTGFSIIEALLVLVVVGILGFTGWYVYHTKQVTTENYSSSESSDSAKQGGTPHGTKVASVDGTYDKYTNYDTGISLTYSKMVANTAECLGATSKVVSVPVQVYEDTAKGKVFVAASKHAVTVDRQVGPGTYSGYDSCAVKGTTLSDIENPISKIPDNNWMLSVEFDYATVADVAGLDAFVAAHAPEGLVVDSTTAPSRSGDVSTYKLKETEIIPVPVGAFFLKYNSSKKVAVFWSTPNVQAPAWSGVDSSGGFVGIDAPVADLIN